MTYARAIRYVYLYGNLCFDFYGPLLLGLIICVEAHAHLYFDFDLYVYGYFYLVVYVYAYL